MNTTLFKFAETAKPWGKGLETLTNEGIGKDLEHVESPTSAVTTAWGVEWDEVLIARDIMENFFDANRERLSEVKVEVEGSRVTVSAPASYNLERLFYLGSEKGKEDIGQYGEGFKATAACLLRDHEVEPVDVTVW